MPTGGHTYSRTETKERSKSLHAPSWVPGEKMDQEDFANTSYAEGRTSHDIFCDRRARRGGELGLRVVRGEVRGLRADQPQRGPDAVDVARVGREREQYLMGRSGILWAVERIDVGQSKCSDTVGECKILREGFHLSDQSSALPPVVRVYLKLPWLPGIIMFKFSLAVLQRCPFQSRQYSLSIRSSTSTTRPRH